MATRRGSKWNYLKFVYLLVSLFSFLKVFATLDHKFCGLEKHVRILHLDLKTCRILRLKFVTNISVLFMIVLISTVRVKLHWIPHFGTFLGCRNVRPTMMEGVWKGHTLKKPRELLFHIKCTTMSKLGYFWMILLNVRQYQLLTHWYPCQFNTKILIKT